MFRDLIAKLKPVSRGGERSDRVSILVPLLIISAGLGVLAWRSYNLSVRFETGANMLAVQFAGYAAEITASRVDGAVGGEFFRAYDEWQQVERRYAQPNFTAFQEWLNRNEWIVSAIYVPDADPANSIFISELQGKPQKEPSPSLRTQEF